MDNIPGLSCRIHTLRKEIPSKKRYHPSRHCFAHGCGLKLMAVWQCVLAGTWHVCHAHSTSCVWWCTLCASFRQRICDTKSSKTAIPENLNLWKFTVYISTHILQYTVTQYMKGIHYDMQHVHTYSKYSTLTVQYSTVQYSMYTMLDRIHVPQHGWLPLM